MADPLTIAVHVISSVIQVTSAFMDHPFQKEETDPTIAIQRSFPPNAISGNIIPFFDQGTATINGYLAYASPSLKIYNPQNEIVPPLSFTSPSKIRYTLLANGQIENIWILGRNEM